MSIKIYSMCETSASFCNSDYNFKPSCSRFSHFCLSSTLIWSSDVFTCTSERQTSTRGGGGEEKMKQRTGEKLEIIRGVCSCSCKQANSLFFLLLTQIQLFACFGGLLMLSHSAVQQTTCEKRSASRDGRHDVTQHHWVMPGFRHGRIQKGRWQN